MALTEPERDRIEAEQAASSREPADAISVAVGERIFAHHHRFPGLRSSMSAPTNHGLTVSRYYFAARPKVVVDIIAQPDRARAEIESKRAFCAERGIRYVVVPDAYADEAVRSALRPAEVKAPAAPADKPARRPAAQKRPRTRAAAR